MQNRCVVERTTDVHVCVHVMYVYRHQCVYMSMHAYVYITLIWPTSQDVQGTGGECPYLYVERSP